MEIPVMFSSRVGDRYEVRLSSGRVTAVAKIDAALVEVVRDKPALERAVRRELERALARVTSNPEVR